LKKEEFLGVQTTASGGRTKRQEFIVASDGCGSVHSFGAGGKGIRPAADADKATLLRRVYFDLIGLPPSPEDVLAFVNNKDPKALEKVVDKLLASPQFGERWGRHWLDVARYAESTGKERNYTFPEHGGIAIT